MIIMELFHGIYKLKMKKKIAIGDIRFKKIILLKFLALMF